MKKPGGVMPFEDIMRAKRLRKQQGEPKLSVKQGAAVAKNNFIKRKPVLKRPSVTNTPATPSNVGVSSPDPSKVGLDTPATQVNVSIARVSPLHVVPTKKRNHSESFSEEQLLADSEPTTPVEAVFNNIRESTSPRVVPRLSTSPITEQPPTSHISQQTTMSNAVVPVIEGTEMLMEDNKKEIPSSVVEPLSNYSPQSLEDIKEAL